MTRTLVSRERNNSLLNGLFPSRTFQGVCWHCVAPSRGQWRIVPPQSSAFSSVRKYRRIEIAWKTTVALRQPLKARLISLTNEIFSVRVLATRWVPLIGRLIGKKKQKHGRSSTKFDGRLNRYFALFNFSNVQLSLSRLIVGIRKFRSSVRSQRARRILYEYRKANFLDCFAFTTVVFRLKESRNWFTRPRKLDFYHPLRCISFPRTIFMEPTTFIQPIDIFIRAARKMISPYNSIP